MRLVAKTLYGLENVLADEISGLGAGDIRIVNRAVTFTGDKELLYRANYSLRTALSVLVQISEFRIRSRDDLYRGGMKIEWDRFIGQADSFSVVPVVNSPLFAHSGYPALVMKDSIADYFRNKSGRRPSVNTTDPGVVINLHISNDSATVSLDSSVRPLFKRGYRKGQTTAPMNEVLAAGILKISGWDASSSFLDPMCGSGTFPIEAGLIACNIAPGRLRNYYGFQRWMDYDKTLYDRVRYEYDNQIITPSVKITCSDISEPQVELARTNISGAGLSDIVTAGVADFRNLRASGKSGFLFLNPPYGERLKPDEINDLYSMIGSTLKHNFPGSSAWLITSNKESLKKVGLKPAHKYVLFNGALECSLVNYEMYEGTRKSNLI